MKKLLGKKPARFDRRTIQFKNILKVLPPIPPKFDVDSQFSFSISNPMFGNDQLGDCVMAARAHMTRRFEAFEQRKLIAIADKDVENEYFKESGGADSGLNMLDSLKLWRSKGWTLGQKSFVWIKYNGQKYDIDAFAQINHPNQQEVKAAIYLLNGIYIGVSLPDNFQDAVSSDDPTKWKPWSDTTMPPNPENGHCIYIKFYDDTYVQCITWGAEQLMTWPWFIKFVDEAYAIVDNKDSFLPKSPLDVKKLEGYLAEVTG